MSYGLVEQDSARSGSHHDGHLAALWLGGGQGEMELGQCRFDQFLLHRVVEHREVAAVASAATGAFGLSLVADDGVERHVGHWPLLFTHDAQAVRDGDALHAVAHHAAHVDDTTIGRKELFPHLAQVADEPFNLRSVGLEGEVVVRVYGRWHWPRKPAEGVERVRVFDAVADAGCLTHGLHEALGRNLLGVGIARLFAHDDAHAGSVVDVLRGAVFARRHDGDVGGR